MFATENINHILMQCLAFEESVSYMYQALYALDYDLTDIIKQPIYSAGL